MTSSVDKALITKLVEFKPFFLSNLFIEFIFDSLLRELTPLRTVLKLVKDLKGVRLNCRI